MGAPVYRHLIQLPLIYHYRKLISGKRSFLSLPVNEEIYSPLPKDSVPKNGLFLPILNPLHHKK